MAKFIGILYDQGGNVWVETCEAEDDNEAYEQLERNDSNLMLFTVEEAKSVRDKISEKLDVSTLDEILKRNIRESLTYALHTSQPDLLKKRLIISEFFHSLNRKGLLLNSEVEQLIAEAYEQMYALSEGE